MATKYVLLITAPQDFISRQGIESVGDGLCKQASKRGGVGWTGWLPSGVLKVRIHCISIDEIRFWMNLYFETVAKIGKSLSVVEQQVEASPIPNIDTGEIPWRTVIRKKLTKKLLKLLPEGAYLISNSYNSTKEVLSEKLGGPEKRETTWRRAVLAGANNRICRLV